MNKRKADEVLSGLDAASEKRLSQYQRNLAKSKDRRVFDDILRDYLLKVSTYKGRKLIEDTVKYCDSLQWNQSKYKPDMIRDQVARFAGTSVPYFGWNQHYKTAKANLIKEVKGWYLKSLCYDRNDMIDSCLPRKDTHAGFAFITTGKRKKGEYCEGLLQDYQREVTIAKENGSFNKPILIGSRTQASPPFDQFTGERIKLTVDEADKKKKSRLVSMIDVFQILAELRYAKRFQEQLALTDWYAGGKSDARISTYLHNWMETRGTWISLDYSSYDQTISDWMIRDAFDIVKEAYAGDLYFDDALFSIVREDFINKVFITDTGTVESKKGVPSGSMFTQIIDSIVNRLMIDTYMSSCSISNYKMMIMGDDNLIVLNYSGKVDELLSSISSYLGRNFGIVMNPEKADFGKCRFEAPHFLSRFWTANGVWRAPEVIVSKMLFCERFRPYYQKIIKPSMIVQCYIETFPLGMSELIDADKHRLFCLEEQRNAVDGDFKWMSGLMAYRRLYLDQVA